MPYDDWGMAYSGSGNTLQVAGGITGQSTVLTNRAAQYDPSNNTWSALPNANDAVFRGGSSCGLYQIGGSTGGSFVTGLQSANWAEVLPGYDDCSGTDDVPWLSESQTQFTLQPGQSVTVSVTADSSALAQPGAYAADLTVSTNSPYPTQPISVSMKVNPPKSWGKIDGTVTDASTGDPLAGATVQICTMYVKSTGRCGPVTYTLKTDSNGYYQLWLAQGYNPLQMIATTDGYEPITKPVKIVKGSTVTTNFALTKESS
jgi:hypothetical protein